MKKSLVVSLTVFLAMFFMTGAASATCDESCALTAQGKGKILVEVYHQGVKVGTVGDLGDPVDVKVTTVDPVYMTFHKQGGLPVPVGNHTVKVYYPGRATSSQNVFVGAGKIETVKMELGGKASLKKGVVQKPEPVVLLGSCFYFDGDRKIQIPCGEPTGTTRIVQYPKGAVIPQGQGAIIPDCKDCPSGQRIIVKLPRGNQ